MVKSAYFFIKRQAFVVHILKRFAVFEHYAAGVILLIRSHILSKLRCR
jgi:hypothetical protein